MHLPLPPHLQKPGTISLGQIYGFFMESDAPYTEGSADCAGGGGSFADGTLTIYSIDSGKVVFTLADTWAFDISTDGTYEVARCAGD